MSNNQTGFMKLQKISKNMADFLNVDPKEKYSIVTISKGILNYIKENKLYNLDDNRIIVPDEKLKNLLDCNLYNLTYFQLQQYLRPHFIKDT